VARIVDVAQVDAQSGSYALTIGECALILGDCRVGDSIAVNGTCMGATTRQEGRILRACLASSWT